MGHDNSTHPPSFFPTTALDHAAAGLGAGVIAVLCMHPLDLLKVKYQVATAPPSGNIGREIWNSLRDIKSQEGWKGLYRGLGPNVAGNAASWGLYFLFYNMLKKRATDGNDPSVPLSAASYLSYSAQASAVTAIMTNPIWVVKVRMFTTKQGTAGAYSGLWDGLRTIKRTEGVSGLFRGTSLALFGVSNGAVQFMSYEKLKAWGFEQKKRSLAKSGKTMGPNEKLSNTSYTVMSGVSKLGALSLTYPYQVIRSRIQKNYELYPTIPSAIKRTWTNEGIKGFYRGLGTNLVRVLPGTCVTFVVYENLAWFFKTAAAKRDVS